MVSVEAVVQSVVATYRVLDDPQFWFVEDSVARDPYRRMASQLKILFDVEEDTDPNDDVSFGYILTRKGAPQSGARWILRASMVGPWAILLREAPGGPPILVSERTPSPSEDESSIRTIVAGWGLNLLDEDLLTRRVPLRLPNAEEDDATLYQALFTDSGFLPWEGRVE